MRDFTFIFKHVPSTWVGNIKPAISIEFLHAALALVSEAGELADLFKKMAFKPDYPVAIPSTKIIDELGDVGYYWAMLCYLCDTTPEEVMEQNRKKLAGGKHGWEDHGG